MLKQLIIGVLIAVTSGVMATKIYAGGYMYFDFSYSSDEIYDNRYDTCGRFWTKTRCIHCHVRSDRYGAYWDTYYKSDVRYVPYYPYDFYVYDKDEYYWDSYYGTYLRKWSSYDTYWDTRYNRPLRHPDHYSDAYYDKRHYRHYKRKHYTPKPQKMSPRKHYKSVPERRYGDSPILRQKKSYTPVHIKRNIVPQRIHVVKKDTSYRYNRPSYGKTNNSVILRGTIKPKSYRRQTVNPHIRK